MIISTVEITYKANKPLSLSVNSTKMIFGTIVHDFISKNAAMGQNENNIQYSD